MDNKLHYLKESLRKDHALVHFYALLAGIDDLETLSRLFVSGTAWIIKAEAAIFIYKGKSPGKTLIERWFADGIPSQEKKDPGIAGEEIICSEIQHLKDFHTEILPLTYQQNELGYFILGYRNEIKPDVEKDFIKNNLQSIGSLLFVNLANKYELKRNENELRRTLLELERSNKELEQFAFIASHDLQEPLRTISCFTQLLNVKYRDKLDSTGQEYIGYAIDSASRMHKLIEGLLDYSRITTKELKFSTVDCNIILQRVLKNLELTLSENDVNIQFENLPEIKGDEVQLIQLFQNLIGNAIKFVEPGKKPHIILRSEKIKDEYRFILKDNGIGIASEDKEKIFKIFERIHSREEYPGTGIGLAICKRIVERHSGKIWVESEPGHGTAFYFTISGSL